MNLTFDETIENHRKMWNWIADETEKRKEIVSKEEYLKVHNIEPCLFCCFCCQYATDSSQIYKNDAHVRDCRLCPINWGVVSENYCDVACIYDGTAYNLWGDESDFGNYYTVSKYAREIANLPSREEVRR